MVDTPIYGIPLPDPGGDEDAWAPILNDGIIGLEAEVKRVEDMISDVEGPYVLKTGDTMTGTLAINSNTPAFVLDSPTPVIRRFEGRTAGVARWWLSPGDSGPEAGGNAGSDFRIYRFDDAGGGGTSALHISRFSGNVGLNIAATAGIKLYVATTAAEAAADARHRFINLSTANDASASLELATAAGFMRGKVTGKREGATANGSLVFSAAVGGGAVDVLTLASDKAATFTGTVTLPGPPTLPLHAATKGYIDDELQKGTLRGIAYLWGNETANPPATGSLNVFTLSGGGGNNRQIRIDKTDADGYPRSAGFLLLGDTLTLSTSATNFARYYVTALATEEATCWVIPCRRTDTQGAQTAPPTGTRVTLTGVLAGGSGALDKPAADALYVNLTGDTMAGALTLSGPPTDALHATTRAYVDAAVGPLLEQVAALTARLSMLEDTL